MLYFLLPLGVVFYFLVDFLYKSESVDHEKLKSSLYQRGDYLGYAKLLYQEIEDSPEVLENHLHFHRSKRLLYQNYKSLVIDDFYRSIDYNPLENTFEGELEKQIPEEIKSLKVKLDHSNQYTYEDVAEDSPYSNYVKGVIVSDKKDYSKALSFYKEGILAEEEVGSQLSIKAYVNLAFDVEDSCIEEILNDKELVSYVEPSRLESYYFDHWQFHSLLKLYLMNSFVTSDVSSVLLALLVTLIWVIYLVSIRRFKKDHYLRWAFVFLSSAIFAELVLFYYHFLDNGLGLNLYQDKWSGLVYCFIGIGLGEELVKQLPLIILLLFFKNWVKEPLDLIVFAIISGLGFAFSENIVYFDGTENVVKVRAMTSTLLHMVLTSLPIYGYIKAGFHNGNKRSAYVKYFLMSVSFHALYDYFLIHLSYSILVVISVLILWVLVLWFRVIMNNAINISPRFNEYFSTNNQSTIILLTGLTLVVFIQHLVNLQQFGIEASNSIYRSSSFLNLTLLGLIGFKLNKFELLKGTWENFDLISIRKVSGYNSYEGLKLKVKITKSISTYNEKELIGEVVEVIKLKSKNRFYLFKLLREKADSEYDYYIIQPKNTGDDLYDEGLLLKLYVSNKYPEFREDLISVAYGVSVPIFKT